LTRAVTRHPASRRSNATLTRPSAVPSLGAPHPSAAQPIRSTQGRVRPRGRAALGCGAPRRLRACLRRCGVAGIMITVGAGFEHNRGHRVSCEVVGPHSGPYGRQAVGSAVRTKRRRPQRWPQADRLSTRKVGSKISAGDDSRQGAKLAKKRNAVLIRSVSPGRPIVGRRPRIDDPWRAWRDNSFWLQRWSVGAR